MDLLVVRHAIAVDAKPGQADADRELASEGVRKFKRSVQGLRELGWCLDRVLTSPWRRAYETTELLAPITKGSTIKTDLLCTKPRPELLALIAEVTGASAKRHATAAVGHEPWLSELVAWLAFGDPLAGEGLELKKGGVVWLAGSAAPGEMKIQAMLPPKMLRAFR